MKEEKSPRKSAILSKTAKNQEKQKKTKKNPILKKQIKTSDEIDKKP